VTYYTIWGKNLHPFNNIVKLPSIFYKFWRVRTSYRRGGQNCCRFVAKKLSKWNSLW